MRSPLYYASIEDVVDRLQYITAVCARHETCHNQLDGICPYWDGYKGCQVAFLFYGLCPSAYDRKCCEEIARSLLHEDTEK